MRKRVDLTPARWPWAALFVGMTVVLLAGTYAYYTRETERIRQEKYQTLSAIAEMKTWQIRQWRQERLADVQTLANSPFFKRALEEWLRNQKNEVLHRDLRDRLVSDQQVGGYVNAVLLDVKGHVLLSAKGKPEASGSEEKQALQEALAKGFPVLTELYRNPQGTALIDAVAPILDPKGQPIAAVCFRSKAESLLYPLVQSWPTPSRTAETLLIRKDGDEVLYLNDLRYRPGTALSLREPLARTDLPAAQAVLGKQGIFRGEDYRGVEVVADLRPVTDTPWFMVAKVDASEILAEVRQRGIDTALFAGLFILLAGSVTAYGYRHRQAWLYQNLHRSERDRREAQEKFRTTLYSIGDAVIATDTEGRVEQMNPVAERLTGWLETEAKGKPLIDVFHIVDEERHEHAENPVQRVLREGVVVGLANHTVLVSRDGTESPIADSGAPIRDEDGVIVGVVLVFSDQTEERATQRELEQSEKRYRSLFENMLDGFAYCKVLFEEGKPQDFIYLSINNAFESITGLKSVVGKKVSEVIPALKQSNPDVFDIYGRVALTGNPEKFETYVAPLGKWFSVAVYCPQEEHFIALFDDITERKRMEESLKNGQRMMKSILSTSPLAIGLTENRRVKWVNRAWEEMFGFEKQDYLGQDASIVYPSQAEYETVGKELYTTLSLGGVTQADARFMRQNGSVFEGHIRMKALDPSDPDQGTIAVIMDISDRKQAEDSLKTSEHRLEMALRGADLGLWDWNVRSRTGFVNSRSAEIIGYSLDEIEPTFDFWASRLHPDDNQMALQKVFDCLSGVTEYYEDEYRVRTKTGELKWILSRGKVVERDEIGRAVRMTGTYLDISARKHTEEALRASEERYRTVADFTYDWEYWIDSDQNLLYVSPSCDRITGYSAREFFDDPKLMERIVHPDDFDEAMNHRQAAWETDYNASYSLDFRIIHRDGQIRWVNHVCRPVHRTDGKPLGRRVCNRDITDRKRSELAQRRLATAVEQAVEAIVITDALGNIEYVNPAFEHISGYTREEVLHEKPSLLKIEDFNEPLHQEIRDRLSRGESWAGRLVKRRKDGASYEEDVTISPVRDSSGTIINFVAVKRDVSQEVGLQRQLLQAQKMEAIGTLAGGIAHDFNNILQVALGYSELLLTGKSGKDPDYDDLQKINQAARSGADLVRNLLTFSRKVEPKPVPMDLNNQVRNVEKLLHRTIPRMIDIRLELADDLDRVNADPGQIEQIIMNLAVNARDAMGERGSLTIRTEDVILDEEYCRMNAEARPGDHVMLSVSDTGHGMDRETLQHIFEPFYTTKELGRGTGLGLAMVYGIVKQHGGHLTCYSEVGKGTTFRVYLPAILAKPEDVAESEAEMPAFGTETLLLVDDEDVLRVLGERILTKRGYTVLIAANGEEALALYKEKKEQISLVILDLIMPTMGGKDCLQNLLKIDPAVKVLIVSGHAADKTMRECVSLGAKGFVSKPFRMKDLLRQVRKTLDES
ncbi:MAG: PAS domain S-box protein [Desulfomonilaceae bacterium]